MRKLLGTVLCFGFFFLFSGHLMAQDQCAKTCVIHAECGIGGQCDQGVCRYQDSYCGNERWAVNDRGETSNCEAYRCSPDTGLCLRQAESTLDCLTGYVFDGKKSCVPSIQCNSSDAHCQDLYERWKKARVDYEATTPEPVASPLSCIKCQDDTGCATSQMCWQNRCVQKKNYCLQNSQGENFQVNPTTGTNSSCGLYACDKVTSACLSSCYKSSDCRDGRTCMAGLCL